MQNPKPVWKEQNSLAKEEFKKSLISEGFYATIAAVIVIELSLDCHRNLRESYCVCDDWCRIPLLPRCLLSMLSFYWPLPWSMPEKPALSPEAAAQGSFSMRNSGHMMQQTKHHFISFSRPFSFQYLPSWRRQCWKNFVQRCWHGPGLLNL